MMSKSSWQEVAKQAQEYRDASISRIEPGLPGVPKDLPLDCTEIPKYLLSTEEVTITQTAPEDLISSLASGRLTSTTVTKAFLRRAGLAQALVRTESIGDRSCSTNRNRPIASQNCSRSELQLELDSSMITSRSMESPLVLYMVFPSVSKSILQ